VAPNKATRWSITMPLSLFDLAIVVMVIAAMPLIIRAGL
jgi:hypothetical protein